MTESVSTSVTGGQAARKPRRGRSVFGGAIGNFVEWYDWTVYGVLAAVFSDVIFPTGDHATSLLVTFSTFAVGFVMRPVGAVVLSSYADRRGRRRMLSLAILVMGGGSLAIAVTPSYETIGLAAPVVFVVARLAQGFSAGGEYQGSSAFLVEHAPNNRRALVGSAQPASIALGVLVATGAASLVTNLVPQPALATWGWRVPFALGALLSLYGLYVRRNLDETPAFTAIEQNDRKERLPVLAAFTKYPLACLRVVGIQLHTVVFYLWAIFLPTYANLVGGLPLAKGLLGSTIGLAFSACILPLVGMLSDRLLGRKPLLLAYAGGFLLLAYPLTSLLESGSFALFMVVELAGFTLLALLQGVMAAVFCEQFPAEVRASGIGVPYALTTALFGGTAPLVATFFVNREVLWGVPAYIMAVSLIGGLVFAFMPETSKRALR